MIKSIQLLTLSTLISGNALKAQQNVPKDEHFKIETISKGLEDAMEVAISGDGRAFIIERKGKVKLYDPKTQETVTVAELKVQFREGTKSPADRETGLLGIALDPKFEKNGWIYLYYTPKGKNFSQLSRFEFNGVKLSHEKVLLEVPRDVGNNICHEGGGVEFGPDGLLYLATGDNTNPFMSNGSAPIDEREGKEFADAQRTASNTNDLRGKILRIKPRTDGGYDIPKGNLFPKGIAKTKPEIYVMGCRNPYRFSIDPKTNYLYWGKVGPDGSKKSERGPRGYDEINQARLAGNFGWPYFSGENQPYADYDFATKKIGEFFDPLKPINESVNNTGLRELPSAQPAFKTLNRSCNAAGPVYYEAMYSDSPAKFPKSMDSALFTYDWNKGKFILIKLDKKGAKVWEEKIFQKHRFVHPTDMEFGANGELYVLEYGSKWYDGTDGKLKRITYSQAAIAIDGKKADPRLAGMSVEHPGTKMISESTCLACHMSNQKSIGPSYFEIAKKYSKKKDAAEYLSRKIIKGGKGVWGEQPMPPHPQHNIEQTLQMAESILQTQSTSHDK
ncbi:MAG: cytochrome c [Cryomorphaceae bacterium]|jgi:cytochrome c